MSYTTAVRRGVSAANRLHRDLGIENRLRHEGGRIDVTAAAAALGLAVLFRPLDGLLGAFLREPRPGALVTTKRSLSVQRLTLAHELGHFFLGHNPSLDSENALRRASIPNSGVDDQEVEAESFAIEFMIPRWLILYHCEKQGWLIEDLHKPAVVYQLSLRVGASYEATSRTLLRHRILSRQAVDSLLAATPRNLKRALLGDYVPADFRGDVWLITRRDTGEPIDGSFNDLFVLRLEEHSGAGYIWTFKDLSRLTVVKDLRARLDTDGVGSNVERTIITRSEGKQQGALHLAEQRPWESDAALHELSLRYDLMGPEEGLPQFERRRLMRAA